MSQFNFLALIDPNARRWLIAIGGAILIAGAAFAIGYFPSQADLTDCQAENKTLVEASQKSQLFNQAIQLGQQLARKDQQLLQKDDSLCILREKIRLDSIDRLSLIESMRAINARYRSQR